MLFVVSELIVHTTYSPRAKRPSPTELAAWRSFLCAHATTAKALDQRLAGAGGLSLSEYDVLLNMAEGPRGGLRPTDLAERVLLTKSGLTRLLDRLVEVGFVERRACKTDRRGQLVVLTATGRRAFKRAAPIVVRSIGTFFSDALAGREIDAFARSCERVTKAAEAMTA